VTGDLLFYLDHRVGLAKGDQHHRYDETAVIKQVQSMRVIRFMDHPHTVASKGVVIYSSCYYTKSVRIANYFE
jgi:hypothetical protein